MLAKRGRQLTGEEQEMMESLKEDYEGHQDKGPDFRFMWIDLDTETEWAELFDIKNTPTVVAVNPHKKVRFLKLAADLPVRSFAADRLLLSCATEPFLN